MTFRTLLIAVAVLALSVGAAFGAGAAYGHRASASQTPAAAPGGQFIQQGAPSAGQGAPGGNPILGTVTNASGNVLTVTDSNNRPVKVTLSDQTRILKQDTGTRADLTAGMRIVVQPQGQPAADGTVSAATIQVVPAGTGTAGQGGSLFIGGQGAPGGGVVPGGQSGQTGQPQGR